MQPDRIRSAQGRERLARVLRAAGEIVTVDDAAAALDVERRAAAKLAGLAGGHSSAPGRIQWYRK